VKRAIWITLLAVLAFAAIVVARLPAGWVIPSAPANVACNAADGTVWDGSCNGLSVHGRPIGDVVWEIHPSSLLAGRLTVSLALTRAAGTARGDVEIALSKAITARNVHIDMPLDPNLIPQLPQGLSGNIQAELAVVQVVGGALKTLEGRIEGHDLVQVVNGAPRAAGSYSLTFPPASGAGVPTGQLRDLGGPLAVEGTLTLTPAPGYEVHGLVAARNEAPADLKSELLMLGSPDAQGRRRFDIDSTF